MEEQVTKKLIANARIDDFADPVHILIEGEKILDISPKNRKGLKRCLTRAEILSFRV